jgi:cyclopropane-fatty-acyl-phospholipid synthase
MDRLLRLALRSVVHRGTLHVITARGTSFSVGDGGAPEVCIRFSTPAAEWALLLDPELKLGEIYTDGTFFVDDGSIADLLDLILRQDGADKPPRWARLQWLARYLHRRVQQLNRRSRSQRNVAHHYDLDGRLYSLFLDANRQYSCAYFEYPGQTLDDAQLAKKRHLAAKLQVARGHRVLDIGCGWGGLALYLAEVCGAQVSGITLSQEQLTVARTHAEEKGFSDAARFELCDYREVTGAFDRIVSVGMFEHVGIGYYGAFFRACAARLKEDGLAVLHAIGRSEGPGVTNPWIAKYIFPGGYIPALSEVLPAIESAGLLVNDIEVLRLHYAETLKAWRERFLAHREEVERLYDARFVRMWEFYLAASEMSFRHQNLMVFQIQMTKQQGVAPMTRDYVAREEARLRALEGGSRPPLRLAGE